MFQISKSTPIIGKGSQTLLVIVIVGAIFILITTYVSGIPLLNIYFRVFSWLANSALALMVFAVCDLIQKLSKRQHLSFVPYLFLIAPFLSAIEFLIIREEIGDPKFTLVFFQSISFLSFMLYVIASLFVGYELSMIGKGIVEEARVKDDRIDSNSTKNIQTDLPGSGSNTLLRVITLIQLRASASRKRVTWTIVIMLLIVIIGGGASFGTVALNEVKKIGELEIERSRMLKISGKLLHQDSVMRGYIKGVKVDAHQLTAFNKELKEVIEAKYGNENSYSDMLKSFETRSYISWPDITMRITIAALTLFLVQVFFHIYKYNQVQASSLFSKAETLELYTEQDADLSELRRGMLSKIDEQSKFPKGPNAPMDEIINKLK